MTCIHILKYIHVLKLFLSSVHWMGLEEWHSWDINTLSILTSVSKLHFPLKGIRLAPSRNAWKPSGGCKLSLGQLLPEVQRHVRRTQKCGNTSKGPCLNTAPLTLLGTIRASKRIMCVIDYKLVNERTHESIVIVIKGKRVWKVPLYKRKPANECRNTNRIRNSPIFKHQHKNWLRQISQMDGKTIEWKVVGHRIFTPQV